MIKRDFGAATRREFDVVVVGGGIYGVSLLQEAARRGLSACLCEAGDFGGGTSWNSLRIVHGGLRYLQTADFPRFFQSVASRRRFALQFPALIRPLDCLMPLYGRGLKRASVMRLALVANDLLSSHRNAGLVGSNRIRAGRVLGAEATQRAFPLVRSAGLEGAASWSDYLMLSSERILMELLRDACRLGALALNYAPVVEVVDEGGVARGVRVCDARTDAQHTITGRAVVNCAGPKVRALARGRGGDADGLFRPSLAFNLMLDRELPCRSALAVAAPEPGAPVLFVIPQDGMLLAGTMHVPRSPDTTEAIPTEAELEQFLGLLNAAIPGLDAGRGNIRRVLAGLLPVTDPGSTNLAKREVLLDHGSRGGLRRLYSVSGVKWTTANDVARQVLGMIGAGAGGVDGCDELPLSPATRLLTQAGGLWDSDAAVLRPVLQKVIEEEAVQSLDDLVLRRSNWAVIEPGLERVRQRVAEIMNGGLLEHR